MPGILLEILGTVRPDGTLELDQKLLVPPGRVKVRVEALEPQVQSAEGLVEYVRRLRAEMAAAGHTFRTQAEIDAEIDALRDEWEESLERTAGGPEELPPQGKPTC